MAGKKEKKDVLGAIKHPADLRTLTPADLFILAAQIRSRMIKTVARTGGHLGPNLGVVELTIALHRVFHSPHDTLIFDTGHQAYVHKMLTGRSDLSDLRQKGGISGYPSREESVHDVVENSHASASLSWADGISREKQRQGDQSWTIAVIGDGALTGGMAWEALNNIAADERRRVMVIVNDNGRSYAPTIGGVAHHLDVLRSSKSYERALAWGKERLMRMGDPGRFAYDALHGIKSGLKDALIPQAMFEGLGLKYLGPVDGHDILALEDLLTRARALEGPVLVHVITEKGRGYIPAEKDIADRFHAVGQIHPETGLPVAPARFGWTSVFAEEIRDIARENSHIVAITAAMLLPVGLGPMNDEFPDRVIDVGIAEQHAVTSAAGMAYMGAHPVVALYATFLNRAFDQVLMDVALHHAGVTFVLDRAGVTGDDGASHNGMWDIAMLQVVPSLRLAAPRDEVTLREELREAVAVTDAPTVLRYGKGPLPAPIPAVRRHVMIDILRESSNQAALPDKDKAGDFQKKRILCVATGSTVPSVLAAADILETHGHDVTVVDPRWLLPVPEELRDCAKNVDLVVTVEDGIVDGGFGWAVRDLLSGENCDVMVLGIPRTFLAHATRSDILHEVGLDHEGIVSAVLSHVKTR
ncbi:1-deoxy-D-xylulose-5-phosphate synthase [Schaalia sp. lx-100]|uniref:1-deoxy-D-xylulose-5-phosphate synthase n=1 Tax=Schaalia sp. lx-100 TaxID=2899081 RepID=UPI001E53F30A|nr:1-deoxy-D-xylulose-5-phosphate synthase [Schaalia sp. lx-100]MCD4558033.1 1-deoxy-D-xylulose-5-phosphate synthase [Schaalia sp. lx-100]